MAEFTVELYYDTGFDAANLPDSPAILAGAKKRSFPAVWEWQDEWQGEITLDVESYNDVRNADYARIGAAYYVVAAPQMVSAHAARLSLTMDPLATIGGIDNIQIKSGWTTRCHVADDGAFENILPEPWAPQEQMVIRHKQVIHDFREDPTGSVNIVIASCNLDGMDELTAGIAKASEQVTEGAVEVGWPEMPSMGMRQGSVLTFPAEDGESYVGYQYQMPGLYAFGLDRPRVRDGIRQLRSLGIESAIVAMYSVPTKDIELKYEAAPSAPETPDISDHIITLTGKKTTYKMTEMPYRYKAVNNIKAIVLYNAYTIQSICSGDTLTYEAKDIYADGTEPWFQTKADPSPTGSVYCAPTFYHKERTKRLEQSVTGSPWMNAGFAYDWGSSGALMTSLATRRQNYGMDRDFDWYQFNAIQQAQMFEQQHAVDTWGATGTALKMAVSRGLMAGAMSAPAPSLPPLAVNAPALPSSTGAQMALPGSVAPSAGMGTRGKVFTAGAVGKFGEHMAPSGGIVNQARQVYNNVVYTKPRMIEQYKYDLGKAKRALGENNFGAATAANLAPPEIAFPVTINSAAYFGNGFQIVQTTLSDRDVARFDAWLTMYGYAVSKPFESIDLRSRVHYNYIVVDSPQIMSESAPASMCSMVGDVLSRGVRLWHEIPNREAFNDNPIKIGGK